MYTPVHCYVKTSIINYKESDLFRNHSITKSDKNVIDREHIILPILFYLLENILSG